MRFSLTNRRITLVFVRWQPSSPVDCFVLVARARAHTSQMNIHRVMRSLAKTSRFFFSSCERRKTKVNNSYNLSFCLFPFIVWPYPSFESMPSFSLFPLRSSLWMHIERRRRGDRNNKVNYYRVENGSARLAPTFDDGTDDDDGGLCCSHTLWLFCWVVVFFIFIFIISSWKDKEGRQNVWGRICMTRFLWAGSVAWRGSSATTVAADAYERQCTIFFFSMFDKT